MRDRSFLPPRGFVVLQVALSMVLLAGAFLMTRSLRNLEHQDFGIVTASRYVLEFDAKGIGYSLDRLPALYRQIEDRFSALPGMAHVGLVRYTPLGGNMWGSCVIPQGKPAPHRTRIALLPGTVPAQASSTLSAYPSCAVAA